MELATNVEWIGNYEQRVITAEGYPKYRVRIEWDNYSEDALDSSAMSAVVKFDGASAQLHTGCGDRMDIDAIGRAWGYSQDSEKLARWLVMTGQAHAVEIVQTPGYNSWGFLVAATPEWVREIWTPKGEETTPEHIEQAKAALHEEALTVQAWIEGEVYSLVPEEEVTVTESVVDPAGDTDETSYEEWRISFGYGPVGSYIGDKHAVAEATDMLTHMIRTELKLEQ